MAAKKERVAAPRKAPRTAKTPNSSSARVELSPDELRKLVSEAAYYRAKQRGFVPGHELEDWIQAEAEVRKRIGA
jgi:hypothetical protein